MTLDQVHFPMHCVMVTGQQVVEEILDAQGSSCPPEYINLNIPKGHPQYDPDGRGGREMPLLRTRYDMTTGYSPNNPRQQVESLSYGVIIAVKVHI